jgi:uncharacterized protein YxjI
VKISIKQQKISFGSQYNIFLEKNEKYYAETDMFSRKIIHLYHKENLIECINIYKSFYFFTPDYKIELSDGNRIKFKTMSMWRTHFQCILENDIYELFSHRERKLSIYKNGIQIGLCKKEAVTILAADNYNLILDFDANVELLISFILILDNMNSRNGGNLFTIDLGIIFKEYRKFDCGWKPK